MYCIHRQANVLIPPCIVVASRVATREVFHIDDHSVSVSLYQRKPDPLDSVLKSFNPETTLVLSSIPDSVSTEHLEAHIDAETGLKAEMHYKLRHHRNSLALVVVPTSRSGTQVYDKYSIVLPFIVIT